MYTFDEARKVVIRACINKLGIDFVREYANSSSTAYGQDGDTVHCFIGVDNRQNRFQNPPGTLTLSSDSKFPFRVSCEVSMEKETIEFTECIVPKRNTFS